MPRAIAAKAAKIQTILLSCRAIDTPCVIAPCMIALCRRRDRMLHLSAKHNARREEWPPLAGSIAGQLHFKRSGKSALKVRLLSRVLSKPLCSRFQIQMRLPGSSISPGLFGKGPGAVSAAPRNQPVAAAARCWLHSPPASGCRPPNPVPQARCRHRP